MLWFKKCKLPRFKKSLENAISDFQYNFFIRLFIESYLLVLLYTLINVDVFHGVQNFDHTVSLVSGVFSLLLLAGLVYAIYKSYKILNHKPEKYGDEDYSEMFGEIVVDLNWKRKWARNYHVVFMIHKLTFCFCVIILEVIPFLQVFLIWWNQLYFLIYLINVKPFDTKLKNVMKIFNGVITLLFYTMCFFESRRLYCIQDFEEAYRINLYLYFHWLCCSKFDFAIYRLLDRQVDRN